MGGEIDRLGLKCIVHRGEDPPAARRHCHPVLDPLWRGVSMRKQRDGEKYEDVHEGTHRRACAHTISVAETRGRPPKHPPTYTHGACQTHPFTNIVSPALISYWVRIACVLVPK